MKQINCRTHGLLLLQRPPALSLQATRAAGGFLATFLCTMRLPKPAGQPSVSTLCNYRYPRPSTTHRNTGQHKRSLCSGATSEKVMKDLVNMYIRSPQVEVWQDGLKNTDCDFTSGKLAQHKVFSSCLIWVRIIRMRYRGALSNNKFRVFPQSKYQRETSPPGKESTEIIMSSGIFSLGGFSNYNLRNSHDRRVNCSNSYTQAKGLDILQGNEKKILKEFTIMANCTSRQSTRHRK